MSEVDAESSSEPETYEPKAILAGLGGILGIGLGYAYVGRLRMAFVVILAIAVTIAAAAWSRLILEPAGFYTTTALLSLISLVSILHPAVIAYRSRELTAKPYNRWWLYTLWIVVSFIIGGWMSDYRAAVFGYGTYNVPSRSMAPTLERHDQILADTWRYRNATPEIDDIVVFEVPNAPGLMYLKRIVGAPGDVIEIRDDVLYRNGTAITEDFIRTTGSSRAMLSEFGPVEVPDDHYFLLGDNRHNAKDSRFIGPIHRDLIHGRAEFRYFARDAGISWSRFPARLAGASN